MAVVIQIEPLRPSAIEGEPFSVHLTIDNQDKSPATLPNLTAAVPGAPTWEILSPPEGSEWRAIDLTPEKAHGDRRRPEPDPKITVPAGKSDDYLVLRELGPGKHRVRVKVPEGAPYTFSQTEVSFTFEALAVRGVSLGRGFDGMTEELWGLVLHAGAAETVFFQTRFERPHAPGDMPEPTNFYRLVTGSANARSPQSPESAFVRTPSLFNWAAWREGQAVCAYVAGEPKPLRLEIGAEATLLEPALLTRAFDLELFLVVGSELVRVRFKRPTGADPGSGAIVWRAPLPGTFGAGAVGIDVVASVERRHVALVSTEFEPRVFFTTLFDDQPPVKWQERWAEAHGFVTGSHPAIALRGERAVVAFVARARVDDRALVLVQADFRLPAKADAKLEAVAGAGFTSERLSFDKKLEPRASIVAFAPQAQATTVPVCVAVGADGAVQVAGRPAPLALGPGEPLAIAFLPSGAYVARVHHGLEVERL